MSARRAINEADHEYESMLVAREGREKLRKLREKYHYDEMEPL